MAHDFKCQHLGSRSRCVLVSSRQTLVYKESSRTFRTVTKRNTVSKKKQNKIKISQFWVLLTVVHFSPIHQGRSDQKTRWKPALMSKGWASKFPPSLLGCFVFLGASNWATHEEHFSLRRSSKALGRVMGHRCGASSTPTPVRSQEMMVSWWQVHGWCGWTEGGGKRTCIPGP